MCNACCWRKTLGCNCGGAAGLPAAAELKRVFVPTLAEPSPYWSLSTSELLLPLPPASLPLPLPADAVERLLRRQLELATELGQLQTLIDSSNTRPVNEIVS